jgi:hypothetical protein
MLRKSLATAAGDLAVAKLRDKMHTVLISNH